MTTISRDVLVAKGTIDALLTLNNHDASTISELGDRMDVADSTTRNRLNELHDHGLVIDEAELRDGQPTRVYRLSESGSEVAAKLDDLLAVGEDEPSGEDPDGTTDVASGEQETA